MILLHFLQDTLPIQQTKELAKEQGVSFQTLNDTMLIASYQIKDTLFDLQRGDVLRKWRGRYFLNVKTSESTWEVTQLIYKKNRLALSSIESETSLAQLQKITNSGTDTLQTSTFDLSKKEFQKLVKENGFPTPQFYIRK